MKRRSDPEGNTPEEVPATQIASPSTAAEWSRKDILGIELNSSKQYYVYIMTNHKNSVLYTGVTSNLHKRVFEHKNKLAEGFTARYNLDRLVYYECGNEIEAAISREKQNKGRLQARQNRTD